MSPLGKFTLAVIGLRLWGAEGFFIGMLLGHFVIDRTHLIVSLQRRLGIVDDNIRLLLPYKYYHYYNQIEGHFWGKIWGTLLGTILFGWHGFIVLFVLGHFVFDTPDSRHARKFRKCFDDFWDAHWGKLAGGIAGFVCRSDVILFCGVIIGFFIDYMRLENAVLLPWRKMGCMCAGLNPLHLWKYSREAKHRAYIRAAAGLAAKVAKADGVVSENEIRAFRKLFEISGNDSQLAAKTFNEAKKTPKGYEIYCQQLRKITDGRLELKESIIDNLFRIARADNEIKPEELELLAKIADALGLPAGNFEVIKKLHLPKAKDKKLQKCYEILGIVCSATDIEIRSRWKELIVQYHPDRLQSQGAGEKEIQAATSKMAEINCAYQELMKFRGVR